MQDIFLRTRMILGDAAMESLAGSHVAVFGLGGVGSYAVEALARSGVGQLTLVDRDTVSPSNINRQLYALHSTIGQPKVEAAARRCLDINPALRVHTIYKTYDAEHREEFFAAPYDFIIDAIDLVSCKLDLISQAQGRGIPIISALGTGNKLDPTRLCISDISKTSGCPLARVMRRELKARGIRHLPVVFSPEEAAEIRQLDTPDPGRRSVPAVNGAAIAAGGFVGLFAGRFLPDRLQKTLMCALALVVIGIAVPGIDDSQKPLVPILSMVLGTLLGELLDLDSAVIRLGDWLQRKTGGRGRFTDGFVNGTMVFAVGAMAIMGALNSGLQGDHTILFSKSVIDGISALIFASTLGVGVLCSAVPVFLWEGLIALSASLLAPLLGTDVIAEINSIGSLLLLAISLNMLGLTKIRLMNLVPAMLFPILLCRFL